MSENSKINFEDTSIAFALKSTAQLQKSRLIYYLINKPWMAEAGIAMAKLALTLRLPVKWIIKKTLFEQFCGGETIEECQGVIKQLESKNVKTILDYSVEGQENEGSFERTMEEALKVADFAKNESGIPFCVVKVSGLGSSVLMEKKQSGRKLTSEENQQVDRIFRRLDTIAARVKNNGLKFMIDAEETWIQQVIDQMTYALMMKYNTDKPVVYATYQLYRRRALDEMKEAHQKITGSGCYFAAKLVRGAYMEKERERAKEFNYEDPIQPDKESTDREYNQALQYALEHIDTFALCAGTHNEPSCHYLTELMKKFLLKNADERVYFAQLLGMRENISFKLAELGYQVAKYVPYGPVVKVMPYLFRRAEENTSVAGQSARELSLVKKELFRRKHK